MKKFTLITLVLFFLFTGVSKSNSCEGVSIANAVGLETGSRNMSAIDPYNAPSSLYIPYAGTFTGIVDGNYTEFYCVDIRNWLGFNEDYSDSAYVIPKINYILQNYFPNKTGYPGQLSLDSSEAAAVQIAIWKFSDNLDVSTLQNNDIVRDRAIEIVNDANLNGATFVPIHTVQIIPVSILGDPGIADTIKVKITDELGNPISGKQINLSISSGSLSASQINTGSDGFTSNIVVLKGAGTNSIISAIANTNISTGRHYIHVASPLTKQKIALAKPVAGNLLDCIELTWDSTSGGNQGGIESTYDMAEAMMTRHLRITNGETSKLISNTDILFSSMFTLEQLIPQQGPFNSIAVETTPFDILGISNATSAYAADYMKNNNRVAVVFATTTNAPEIYSHSKNVCDRFGYSELQNLIITYVNNREFYIAKLYNPITNQTDYSISFSVYESPNGHLVDNKWAIEDYFPPTSANNVYNFQVWGLSEFAVKELVKSILDKFDSLSNLSYQTVDLVNPDVWIESAKYHNNGKIIFTFNNKTTQTINVPLTLKLRREQNSQTETLVINVTLSPDISQVEVPIGLLSSANISAMSPAGFKDAVFVGSGMYGNYSGPLSSINSFDYISNYGSFQYPTGAYAFTGGINMNGQLGDIVYIARSINAAFIGENLTEYNNLQFKAKGNGTLTTQLEVIINGEYFYPYINTELTNDWTQLYISLNEFIVNGQPVDRSNVKMILFKFDKAFNLSLTDYNYSVKDIFFEHSTTNIAGNTTELVEEFKLNQNFPNPFNPQTTITFDIAKDSKVTLKVYDMLGREVSTLVNENMRAGKNYSVSFDGKNLASGMYIYRLTTQDGTAITKRMMLIK